jgi:hypothetical protein
VGLSVAGNPGGDQPAASGHAAALLIEWAASMAFVDLFKGKYLAKPSPMVVRNFFNRFGEGFCGFLAGLDAGQLARLKARTRRYLAHFEDFRIQECAEEGWNLLFRSWENGPYFPLLGAGDGEARLMGLAAISEFRQCSMVLLDDFDASHNAPIIARVSSELAALPFPVITTAFRVTAEMVAPEHRAGYRHYWFVREPQKVVPFMPRYRHGAEPVG